MPFTIKKEAPKAKLVTMGQGSKEIEMAKETTYESNPELYHLRPGTTEPELKNPESAGVKVTKTEPADKPGPVGAKEEPQPASEKTAVGKKK